jgi:hypothetical protein
MLVCTSVEDFVGTVPLLYTVTVLVPGCFPTSVTKVPPLLLPLQLNFDGSFDTLLVQHTYSLPYNGKTLYLIIIIVTGKSLV